MQGLFQCTKILLILNYIKHLVLVTVNRIIHDSIRSKHRAIIGMKQIIEMLFDFKDILRHSLYKISVVYCISSNQKMRKVSSSTDSNDNQTSGDDKDAAKHQKCLLSLSSTLQCLIKRMCIENYSIIAALLNTYHGSLSIFYYGHEKLLYYKLLLCDEISSIKPFDNFIDCYESVLSNPTIVFVINFLQ